MTDVNLSVHVQKTVHASRTKVFDAWLNAETVSQFMLPMPGMEKPDVKIDGKKGGKFVIVMNVGDDKIPHKGEYLDVSPHSKIVFTWESPFSIEGSTVTLIFSDAGENKTLIDLTHVKFPDEESRGNHEGGWENILQCLHATLTE